MNLIHRSVWSACALAVCACQEAPAAELPGYSPRVLPRGSAVASVEDDPVLAARLTNNAAVSGPDVPLHVGWVNDAPVSYWDFGTGTDSVEPVWVLKRKDGDALEDVDHPPIVDTLPGDDAYTPFRAMFIALVTRAYDGERITSFAALEDAVDIGLIEEPTPTGNYVSWPIVPSGTTLERSGDGALETKPLYAQGHTARYLPLAGERPFMRSVSALTAYLMQRQNESGPLDESAQGADLNGDGDQLDSNTIFEVEASDPMHSGLWAPVTIIVHAGYEFEDTRAEAELFSRTEMGALQAVPGAFIEYAEGGDLLYRPLYAEPAP